MRDGVLVMSTTLTLCPSPAGGGSEQVSSGPAPLAHAALALPSSLCSCRVRETVVCSPLQLWPGVMDELSELREFYDPDTVELMHWIK